MMRTRFAAAVLFPLLVASAGCGPIIGQVMKASTGLKEFKVVSGSVQDFAAVGAVVVIAPFPKTEKAYYISRGEDEWHIADGFRRAGLFATEYVFEGGPEKATATFEALRGSFPTEVQKRLSLAAAPDAILTGELLEREETVAPTVGIIQQMRLRLDLTNLKTRATTSIEISVKAIHKDTIPLIVSEIVRRARAGS
jgi:hypothetical protein